MLFGCNHEYVALLAKANEEILNLGERFPFGVYEETKRGEH